MSADGEKPGPKPGDSALDDALGKEGAPVDDLALAFFEHNDMGNSQRLLARHGRDIRTTPDWGEHVWVENRWELDRSGGMLRKKAQATAAAIYDEARALRAKDVAAKGGEEPDEKPAGEKAKGSSKFKAHWAWAVKSGNSGYISNMIRESMPEIELPFDQWNARPDLFNCANGTLQLKTDGKHELITPHRREHFLTRMGAAYDPKATCPHFRQFIADMLPDKDVLAYVKRVFGSCLTDSANDQVLVIFHGGGRNGKGTALNAIAAAMGDYMMTMGVDTILQGPERRGSEASPDLARLAGRPRLVRASEPPSGARLSDSNVKTLTGDEPITARKLREDIIEFLPNFKVILSCNNRPSVYGGDDGIWRRLMLVPWTVQIPKEKVDKGLPLRLAAEASGILNWMIEGWEDWIVDGLSPPAVVLEASEEYRHDSDETGRFLAEWCLRDAGVEVDGKELFRAFEIWRKREGQTKPISANAFGRRLTDRGIPNRKSNGDTFRIGLRLTEDARQAVLKEQADEADRVARYRRRNGGDDDEE